jgi:putative transposase
MKLVIQLRSRCCSAAAACDSLGVPRPTYYRSLNPPMTKPASAVAHPSSLNDQEKAAVLGELTSDRFGDIAVPQVYATLLDEGRFLCSMSTMYRLLRSANMLFERRRQVSRPHYPRPELLATSPNQVWSWDITKLKGPVKWTYFYLYVILDIFSRYVVGWLVANCESSELARALIEESCTRQGVQEEQLTLHSDRGSSMKSKPVAHLLSDLGVTKSHSRPHVSNDNPFSESNFKTLKYRPEFPDRFGSLEHARNHCRDFFPWYNDEHHHSGISMLTPADLHYGRGKAIVDARHQTMLQAFEANPRRFHGKMPKAPELPSEVWINKPMMRGDEVRTS